MQIESSQKLSDEYNQTSQYWNSSEKIHWLFSLFVGLCFVYSTRILIPICLPIIAEDFAWNRSEMGIVLAAFYWGYMIPQLMSGWMADKLGGEQIITLSSIGWSFVVLLYPFAIYITQSPVQNQNSHLLYVMLALRILHGIFQGCFLPSIGSLMSTRVCLSKRTSTFTQIYSGSYLGTILAGFFGSILLEQFSWKIPFYIFGFLSLLWVLFTRLFLIHDSQSCSLELIISCLRRPRDTFRTFQSQNSISQSALNHNTYPVDLIKTDCSKVEVQILQLNWKELFRLKPFWAMLIGQYGHGHLLSILISWLPTYFEDTFPTAQAWVFNVIPWVVCIPFAIIAGFIADRLIAMTLNEAEFSNKFPLTLIGQNRLTVTHVRKLMESICLLGAALCMISMRWAQKSYCFSLFLTSMAVAFSAVHCAGILLNPQDMLPEHGGYLFGMLNTLHAVPGFLAVYLAGLTLDYTQSWISVFDQTAFVCILSLIVYLIYGSSKRIRL